MVWLSFHLIQSSTTIYALLKMKVKFLFRAPRASIAFSPDCALIRNRTCLGWKTRNRKRSIAPGFLGCSLLRACCSAQGVGVISHPTPSLERKCCLPRCFPVIAPCSWSHSTVPSADPLSVGSLKPGLAILSPRVSGNSPGDRAMSLSTGHLLFFPFLRELP